MFRSDSTLARPFCRALTRGSLGDTFDGRSREGKVVRRFEAELVAQLGGKPSFGQLMLVRQAARATLQLEVHSTKMSGSSRSEAEADARTFRALNETLVRALEALGVSGVRSIG
jgi:hypothetical protein